jgi:putative DNA primase/helicase
VTPIETVRGALEHLDRRIEGRQPHDFMAQCPSHPDGRPSLHVTEARDGRVLLRCFAACETPQIVADLGLAETDLFPDGGRPARDDDWTPEREYVYVDADGRNIFKVVRFPGKRFRQQRWVGSGWEWGLDGVTRQLWKLPDVLRAKDRGEYIFVCEGEKDAEAVGRAGQVATTMSGGAGKWEPQYTETLAGAKVVILADDDEPGLQHAWQVYRRLYGKTATVGVRLPAEGFKDVSDHLAAGKTLHDFRKPVQPGVVEGTFVGRSALTARVFSARKNDDRTLLGPLIQKGMLSVVGAQTGEGKTTLSMQAIGSLVSGTPFLGDEQWRPRGDGHRALLVDLEQGEATVQRRLAEAGLGESERVDILWEPSGIALDAREEDRAMVRDVLRDGGYSLVVLDPLYQTHLGSANDDQVAGQVMRLVAGWARDFNVAVLVPMHARKPPAGVPHRFTKHDIAGSSVWLRMVDFVLGLQLRGPGFSQLWFFKDRVGLGPEINGWWGLSFDREQGFARNMAEEKGRIKRELEALVDRDEGASREELLVVLGADELSVERLVRRKNVHEQGGRYRSKPWQITGQTSMLDGADVP